MTIAHDPNDGWKPLTNDLTWPGPVVVQRPIPSFAGGTTPMQKELWRLEKELGKMAARVDALERRESART